MSKASASTDVVIGIDLGTTTCCMAYLDAGTPTVIPNRGYLTTPSVVAISPKGERVVGHAAKRQAVTNAENTVIALKRLIGRKWGSEEVETTRSGASYELVEGPHGDVRIQLRGDVYALPELSAMLLQDLRLAAETHLGRQVSKAVVTVPAYFNDNQRQATRDAGQIAGLEILRIINEPTAAALAYGFGKNVEKTLVVYDLGGGTFDISIVKVKPNGDFEVLGTGGDTFLGGEDFDRCIMDWLVLGFKKEHKIDLAEDRVALQRLKDAAEKAKCMLSAEEQAAIELPFIATPAGLDPLHLKRVLPRKTFEVLSRSLVQRTLQECASALKAAGLAKDAIDDVLLVGGSSRIPAVHNDVTKYFGKKPCQGVHPDEAVAVGAAIHAASLVGQTDAVRLFDVTPHGLGIKMTGNRFTAVIPQNTRVPAKLALKVTTNRDGQTQIRFVVLQGNHEEADKNELLGEFMLTGLRPAAAFAVSVNVEFALDEDGIVHVTAKDNASGAQQSIQVTATSGLTPDEIGAMSNEASDFMQEALAAEEVRLAHQELHKASAETERTCAKLDKTLKKDDLHRDVLMKAQAALGKAKMALAGKDARQMKLVTEDLGRRLSALKVLKV